MVNGLPGMQNQISSAPPRLYPTPVSQYDPNPQPEASENDAEQKIQQNRPTNARTSAKKGKTMHVITLIDNTYYMLIITSV